jgi:HEAT repeat protein
VRAAADLAPEVRRRAAELAPTLPAAALDAVTGARSLLGRLLDDPDDSVVEVAAWASGERSPPEQGAVDALAAIAMEHRDALCREAAVAALGSIGDPAGLPAILAATHDKATVRRRATIALAPFEGPEVDEALHRLEGDRDAQVRQAAEDLLGR